MNTVMTWCGTLVLPLAVLLFAQWPLRDWVQAYSRQTNDIAQILFALYVAAAVTAASHANAHLSAAHQTTSTRIAPTWRRFALLFCIAPWALLILWSSAGQVWQSVLHLERFAETGNLGFFVIKFSAWLMALLALAHSAFKIVRKP